jgi:hypothetical protein
MPPKKSDLPPSTTKSGRPKRAASSKSTIAAEKPAEAKGASKRPVKLTKSAKSLANSSNVRAVKPLKKSISKSTAKAMQAKESPVQSGAVIRMAATALSMRIVAAVEDIYKDNIPRHAYKATQQLAATMAKTIVEAAANADKPFKASKSFSFTNVHGELFELAVDASGKCGSLAGDETDWEAMLIKDDALQDDFMFNREELEWLRKSWKSATGRELKHPTLTAEEQLLQAGVFFRNESLPHKGSIAKGVPAPKKKRSDKQK